MQEADEQDTCRICSAPAEPDQPLFHPCKCSGTIRYIHQDCLTTWLAHSKKKSCDVCKHPYSFTKVYASDMPPSLPPVLLIRRLIQHALMAVLFLLRGVAVATIWLGFLPWVTVWTWRMYFAMGESTAWWISNRPRPSIHEPESAYSTIPSSPNGTPIPPSRTLVGRVTSHPVWLSLSADIFRGQIIASLMVLTFVAIFLLREWISQNARPGVFEEEEVLPDNRPAAQAPAAPQQLQPRQAIWVAPDAGQPQPGQQENARNVNAFAEVRDALRQRLEENRAMRVALQAAEADPGNADVVDIHGNPGADNQWPGPQGPADLDAIPNAVNTRIMTPGIDPRVATDPESWQLDETELEGRERRRLLRKRQLQKGKRRAEDDGVGNGGVGDNSEGQNSDKGNWLAKDLDDAKLELSSRRFRKQVLLAKKTNGRQTDPLLMALRRDPLIFGPVSVPTPKGKSKSDDLPGDDTEPSSSADASPDNQTPPEDETNPFPAVVLQPPKGDIPFSLRDWNAPPSTYLSPPTPRVRPSLASTSTPFTFSMDVNSSSASSSNLVTYRAPEEFQAQAQVGPSTGSISDPGYFDNATQEGTSMDSPPPSYEEGQKEIMAGVKEYRDTRYHEVHEGDDNDRSKGKRRQIDFEQDEDDDDEWEDDEDYTDKGDVDKEAELRRYFRERDEPEQESVGLMLDMDAYRRDFPKADTDDDTDSDHPHMPGGHRLLREGDYEDQHHIPLEDNGELEEAEDDEDEQEFFGDGLFDDDDVPWEDVEDEEDLGLEQVPGPEAAEQPPQAGGAEEPGMGGNFEGEEVDGNVEDDMEGALEAIGLRGPVFGVFQNAALMIFVLDTAIGIGIWIPFTIGKTAALLTLDPRRLMQVLHLPIRAMRIITDPIVDFVAYLIVGVLLPGIVGFLTNIFLLASLTGAKFLRAMTGDGIVRGISSLSSKIVAQSRTAAENIFHFATQYTSSNTTQVVSESNTTSTFVDSIPDYLGFTEPYFATLGEEVRVSTAKAQATWIQLALGSEPANRIFAIALGYTVVSFGLAIYLNLLTVGNARTAGLAVRNAVRQQLLVLKVAAFIFIELVTFPLGCGIVLDLCTVWMFPEASLQTRIAFFVQAPLTAMFYHWVAGTMFMYSFAVLLSGCRSVMRPGAMWFIKDPQDQNSHPIRDILDRPTLTQLRKICVSGLMYSFVVACVVGSVAGLLILGNKSQAFLLYLIKSKEEQNDMQGGIGLGQGQGLVQEDASVKAIMPFRWKNRDPLSNVPIDLIFLHLVLPYTMHYFRPKRVVKNIAMTVWKFLATRLRLTSYFFGGRHPREEYTPKNWKENFIRGDVTVVNEEDKVDGSFRRVPATDNLALPRDMRATAAVTADGEPVDEEAKKLIDMQNAETEKAKKDIKEDYTIVYMPPHFRYRIIAFITLLWIFGSALVGIAVALPILLGRSFFNLFTSRQVHDGYSLIMGFYLIWMCYLIAKAIDRLDKRRQRRSGDGPRANLTILVLKRGLLWTAKTLYMVFCLGIVIPVLLAIVVDLYMVLPIRFALDPDMIPRIRVVDEWALGLLYAKIVMHAHHIQPPNRITRGLANIMQHGWTHPNPVMATKEVIAPLGGGLLAMIIFPGAVFRTVQHFFPGLPLDNRFIFMHVYPSVFITAGAVRSVIVFGGMLRSWSQAIRDKEFLVEMRLKNHEPEPAVVPAAERSGELGASVTDGPIVVAAEEAEVVLEDGPVVVGGNNP